MITAMFKISAELLVYVHVFSVFQKVKELPRWYGFITRAYADRSFACADTTQSYYDRDFGMCSFNETMAEREVLSCLILISYFSIAVFGTQIRKHLQNINCPTEGSNPDSSALGRTLK